MHGTSSFPRSWLLLAAVLGSSGLLLWYFCCRSGKKRAGEDDRPEPVNKVLFFPDKSAASLFPRQPPALDDQQAGSLAQLMQTLRSAVDTLDVCMFTLSCRDLTDVLIEAHQRGVVVRVVTDNEQLASSGSQVEHLRRAGVQVRPDNTAYLMHHKFALVDGRCVASGSLNWTLQGVYGNQENVVITETPSLVQPFVEQFQILWDMYDPDS